MRFCRCFEEFVFRHSIVKKLICFTLLVSIAKDFTLCAVIDAKFEPPPPFFKGAGIDLTKNPKKKDGGGGVEKSLKGRGDTVSLGGKCN